MIGLDFALESDAAGACEKYVTKFVAVDSVHGSSQSVMATTSSGDRNLFLTNTNGACIEMRPRYQY